MTVSAKETRAALKRHVVPLLRAAGFDDGTPSKFWRHREERIDYIEIVCLSAYMAQSLGATTASFTVRLGVNLPGYSALVDRFHRDFIKQGPKGPRPSEAQMPIRGMMCPADAPAMKKGRWGWEVHSTWHVKTAQDATEAAQDLGAQLERYGLDWLGRDWSYEALREILARDETAPILIASDNGSHLRLQAEVQGSQVRAEHISMVNAAMRRQRRG